MIPDADKPKLITLADDFVCRQEIDNPTWFDCGDFAVAVDALEHAEQEDDVFEAIGRTIGDTPIRYLVNTHTHYDHVALNEAFRRRGAELVNMQNTSIPESGMWIEGTTRRAQLVPMPGCHTDEDLVVWVPSDRVLLVGDIFGWGLIPLTTNLRGEAFEHLENTINRLIDYDAETVVPGHGPLATTDTLRRYVDYLHWLIDEVKKHLDEGLEPEQVVGQIDPPEDMRDWWRFVEWKHDDSVGKVAKAASRGWI